VGSIVGSIMEDSKRTDMRKAVLETAVRENASWSDHACLRLVQLLEFTDFRKQVPPLCFEMHTDEGRSPSA